MDLTKILELLGANKLDEAVQTELSEKIAEIIEVKAKELSQEQLDEMKKELIEEYEKKFDEYKEDVTDKFSNFVDGVLESEMQIPGEIVEFARKGQLYHDLIEQFKVRIAVDQGLLDEETKSILGEAKDEIVKLRESNDDTIKENLELRSDAQELAARVYLYEKCEGMTENQRKHVFSILEGITDKDEIDRKFEIVKESERFDPVEVGNDEGEKAIKKNKKKSDPKNNEDQVEEDEDQETKGQAEVSEEEETEETEEKKVDEDSPFTQLKEQYLQVLKEGRIT
jgi:hypothetical protein